MANITRIKNNQITDANVVAYAKLQSGTITGNLFAPSVTINSNVTITGNLTTFGNIDSISATNTYVNDPLVVFNNGFTGTPSYDIGILVNRNLQTLPGYGAVNTAWIWEENTQTFQGIATTETGATQGQINNSGFANLMVGAITASSITTSSSVSLNSVNVTNGATFSGAVQINNTLGVSGATTLSSTLTTTGVAKFNSNIVAAATTASTSTTTGSIISAGGIGLVGNLISGAQVQANNGLYSVSTFNGVYGDGIVVDYTTGTGRISVGGGDGLTIYNGGVANTALLQIASSGIVTIPATTTSSSTTTGALVVSGGLGIAGNEYIGGTLNVTGATTLSSTLGVTGATTLTTATTGGLQAVAIGNVTPGTGAFTTLSSSGLSTLNSVSIATTLGVTGATTLTTATTGGLQAQAIGNVTPGTGVFTTFTAGATTLGLTTATAINNTPIGNATPNTGAFTTLSSSGLATLNSASITTTLGVTGATTLNTATAQSLQAVAIGNVTPGTGAFTTLNTSGLATLNSASVTTTLGVTGATTLTTATIGGLQAVNIGNVTPGIGNFTTLAATNFSTANAVVTGGSIDNTPVGATTASTGRFTTITGTSSTASTSTSTGALVLAGGVGIAGAVYAGSIQATPIGSTTASSGAFTTLSSTSTTTLGATTATSLNSTPIGATTASTGAFTTLSATGVTQVTNNTNNSGTTYSSGALQVTGGAGFGGNVYVAGNLFVQGSTYETSTEIISGVEIVAGVLTANSGTASTSTTTGALLVNGGAGVTGAIYAGSIQATPIGSTTASTGAFTALSSTSTTTLGATTATSLNSTPIGTTTASSGAFTTLSASGITSITNATASTNYQNGALVVTGGVGIGGALNVNGSSSFTGNMSTGNVIVTGSINAAVGAVASYNGVFYGNAQTGFGALYAGLPTGYSIVPNELAQFTGNGNSYVQINSQNISTGNQATTDWIATANNGTDTTFYVDLGIAGSNYNNLNPNNSLGTSLYPNDAYLYAQGQASSFGGNLVVGTSVAGTVTRIIAGGINASSIIGTFSGTGLTINSTTASTNTTTGALIVDGGVGIAGALNVGGSFNLTGTLSTANAQISGGAITNTPISGSTGSFTYLTATTGFSTSNVLITGGTINGTVIGQSVSASGQFTLLDATTGFSTANAQITGGAIVSTAITGTVATSQVALTNSVSVSAVNASFYPTFVNATSGNVAEYVNSALTFNPSNGTLSSTTFSGIGSFSTLSTTGVSTLGANVVITSGTDVTMMNTGALLLTGNGGINAGGSIYTSKTFFTGVGSLTTSLTNPSFIGVNSGSGYTQSAMKNLTNTGSADWIAYGNNYPGPTNDHGWVDVGFTSDAFADPSGNYTITKPNDGYIFASGANTTVGGNLVLSTDYTGGFNDVVVGVGSFYANAEVARFHGNVSTSGNFTIKLPTNPAPAANVGAFQVWGGSSVSGNAYVGGYTVLGGSQTAGSDTVVKGKNDSTLVWSRSGASYDQVLIGGSATTGTLTNYAKLAVNSVDSMLLPVGMSSQRPSNLGGTDIAGMLRYNTTLGTVEWYNGTAWTSTGSSFTIIVDQQFNGDGATTGFTLTKSATTASVLVNINGVSQIPTLAYSVAGTTLTFTEAPQVGDVIDVRILTTQVSINNVSSASGSAEVLLDQTVGDNTIRFITNNTEAVDIDPNGNIVQKVAGRINLTPTITVGTTPTAIDVWNGATYKVAKYLVSAHNAGNTIFSAVEALVVTDGASTVNITSYNNVNAGGSAQVSITASITGSNVTVFATGVSTNTVVKFDRIYM